MDRAPPEAEDRPREDRPRQGARRDRRSRSCRGSLRRSWVVLGSPLVALCRLVVAAGWVVAGKPEGASGTGGLRSSRASLTRSARKCNGVHKNDTSCKPTTDTLGLG